MKSKHVLVAEQKLTISSVVEFNLVQAGFDVTVASDGQAAFEQATAGEFDVIICGQQMTEISGPELCRRLRASDRYAITPIILLTAQGLEQDIASLREELQISAALPRPFSPDDLVHTVEKCLAAVEAALQV